MTRLFRILLVVVIATIGLALLAAALVYIIAGRSIPDFDKDVRVAGINGRVEILRDNHAIPHIFADHEADVFFGLGYAHAEDRLWQMLIMRRAVQGRLSEIFGPDTLEIDELMRTLNLNGVARASLARQSDEGKAVLDAYANGVNARLNSIRTEALGRGAPELFLFSNKLAPWTPTDSLAVIRLMAMQLTDKAQMEVKQARLSLSLTQERLRDLFPDEQGKAMMALPDFAALMDAPLPQDFAKAQPRHPLDPIRPVGFAGASNAFAAAPARSAAGATLLATDPHLSLSAPGIWMLARLELDTGGVIGATIPGMPAIVIGRNASFGWGLTSSYLDDQDLFIEKLNPENPDQYLTPSGYQPITKRELVIEIKDQPGTTITTQHTRHGPVIDAKHWSIANILPPGHLAALSWVGFDPDDRSVDSFLGLMRAKNVADGREATRHSIAFAQVVTMADKDSIAMQASGRMPNRSVDHTSKGRIPSPGWLGQNDWQGYLPFEDNPFVMNPQSGVIATTNNRLTDDAFPKNWSFEFGDDQRIQRAEKMLNQREFHTLDSFIEIQTDTVSTSARTLIPLIAQDLWYFDEPSASGTAPRRRQQALELLANWNGDMTEHDPEPLIYAAWVRALQHRLTKDELTGKTDLLKTVRPLFIERVYRDIDGAAIWCDVIQTPRAETCGEIAQSSLDTALLELTEKYGDRIESWRWGGVHQALHRHEVLGSIPLLSWFVNIRHDTPGGDNTLLRGKTIGHGKEPFLNTHAAGFRAVYDFSDPEASVFIIATGQSGHFLSRHYDDLAQLWRRSEYIPMTLNPILARGGSVGITVLLPLEE